MNIMWEVKRFYPIQNIFRVRYWTDICKDGIIIDLPLPFDYSGEKYYDGNELDEYLKYNAPVLDLKVCEYLDSMK